jgi:hypothetical protein
MMLVGWLLRAALAAISKPIILVGDGGGGILSVYLLDLLVGGDCDCPLH